jgi:hypothetical protein
MIAAFKPLAGWIIKDSKQAMDLLLGRAPAWGK